MLFRAAWQLADSVEEVAFILEMPVRRVLALAHRLRGEGKYLPDLPYQGRSVLAYLDRHVTYLDFFRAWQAAETVEGVAHKLGRPLVRVLGWEQGARAAGIQLRRLPRRRLHTLN
jgi:hypothetical protein